MVKIYSALFRFAAFRMVLLMVFGRDTAKAVTKAYNNHNKIYVLLFLTLGIWSSAQTQSLEFAAGDSNPTATNGPAQNTSIRFRYNIDNPNGNTFQTYTPAVTASFQLINQQYTLSTISTNQAANFGHTTTGATPILQALNSYGAPSSNWFTSSNAATGTGIDPANNYGVIFATNTSPLRAAALATNGTYRMTDLVVTFSQAVNNPTLHIGGMGGFYGALGFSQQYDLISSNTPVTLTRLSGSNVFAVSGTNINNTATVFNSSGTDNSGSGSVRINGTGITTLTFRVYLKGDGGDPATTAWAASNTSAVEADVVTLSFSLGNTSTSCITSQPGSTPRNLCQNVTPAPLSVTATGATSYQWYYSDAADGGTITTVAGATSASYTPPTTATFATRYYFVTVETSCGTASTYPRTPVTVNANPTFTSNPAASTQTVCLNGTPTNLTVAAAAGNTYQWYSNTTNSNTGGTLIAGATSGTFTPPTNVAGTTYYYAVITNTTTGCTATSNVRGVTVLPELAITTQPNSTPQNLCVNSTGPTLTVTATGATTYQWFYSNAATGGTITTVTGATSASYTIPTTTAFATRYYYVTVGNGTCTVTSNPRTPVTVNANPTFTTNLTAGTQTVCLNGTVTALTVAAPAGNTYQWYSNTTNSNTGGTPISGATSASYTPPSTTTGTTYYYAVITNTTTGCTATSNVRGVIVLPELAITTQPNSTPQNLCVNSIGPTLTVTAAGATTYQWFYSNAATGGTLTTVTGATSASYTIPTTTAFATRYYYVTVGNGTCTVTSSPRTPVTVNANPTFTTNLTAGTQTVCLNGTVTTLTVAAAAGNTYQWYRNTTNSNVGGTPISGATSASYTPSSTTAGTTYYYAVITNTTTGCTAASNVRGVNVLPELAITTQPNSTPQNLCLNSSGATLTVTATGATTYQWFYSNAATGGTITTVTGATSASYTIPTTTAFATRYYYVTVGNGTCTVTSSPRTPVTVNANPTFTSNPAASSQTVCQNAATTSLSVAGTGVTYQWYSNTTNSNTGGTPIAGATSATFTPPSTKGGTTYYYAVITSTTTGCSTPSNVRSVVVNGISVENLNAQTVCQNTPANTLGVITSPAATAYQWYYNTTNTNVGGTLISGATTSTYIPPSSTLGTLYYFVQITTAGCTARSNTAQVNIVNTGCPDLSISCNTNLYLSQNSNTQLYLIDKSTNPFTYPPIGVASAIQYNGIGIDPVGGGMYGMKNGSRTLIKINNDGTYAELGDITGMPASTTISYNTGEFDDQGNYYVTPTGSGVTIMYKVNVTTRTATTVTLSQGLQISDLAYNVNDGKLYAVNIDGRTVSIDPSTGVVTFIGPATGTVAFGAMFGSPNGIFGADNNGGFYRIDTVTGARFRISDSPSSGTNDGAHCVTAPITFDADLYVTKTDNTQFYTPGSSTVYTVVVGNNGPFGVQNATVTDAIPTGIPNANMTYTAVASSGSVTNITGAGTGAINDIVSLPVGGTVTYTVTITIPLTFTGNLTNTATITAPASTSDTNLSNNTATDTDIKAITACDPVVWYHTDDDKLYAADVNTGVARLICDNFYTVDEGVFDIGYDTNGTMYTVNYNYTEGKSYFYRFNTANCTFTRLTNTGTTELSAGSNSLSFLPDGTGLLGNNFNTLIQRVTITGNNYTLSNWYNIVDPNAAISGGDFILFEGKVYASMLNSSYENYIYELALDGSYNVTGIQNIYADASGVSELMFGMAQVGGDIYGGFTDNTVRKLTFSAGTMSLSANVLNAPTSGQVYGMTSLQEAFGVQTPVIASNPAAVNGTVTVCSTNPISVTLTSSLASNIQWYKDNAVIPGATSQNYIATALGSYTVAYTNTNGCLYTSDPIVIAGGASCACYKPGAITGGTLLDTKVGITSLARAGETDADNWPMVRKGGWIALEAKTKGLVVNRVAFSDADGNPSTPDVPTGIPSTDFVEGMVVYDTTNHCLKMYTSTDNGVSYHWYCISTQTCPD
ncbi:beta strand repeat-containing protein [Epilithonimonas arachidiradicis]|uniref:Gliding motility-associated-like protein n=2 Tax=Epilithonimonas arachidiradicis TaxID=1617282 RepID=A0A420DF00_9FLAO|nr:DUF11 domain-containing protein [Epilithonimonas arachidiradicis]RKE90139.1 hypothetical protein BXY58_0732 [Epilithonimonas arachidiradicis]